MAQNLLPPIDPSLTSGTQLANLLNAWAQAVDTSQAGNARPIGLDAGGMWLNTSDPNLFRLMLFNGAADVALLQLNNITGQVAIAGAGTLAPNGTQDGSPATSMFREIGTAGSLTGGGNFTSDHILSLIGDVAPGTWLPNYYFGRNAANQIGWSPLPSVLGNLYRMALFANVTTGYTFPADARSAKVTLYAGGSAVYGACLHAYMDITPGGTYSLVAGDVGQFSHFNAQLFVFPDGTFEVDPNFTGYAHNSAPRRRYNNGLEIGAPGCPGFVEIEFWGN